MTELALLPDIPPNHSHHTAHSTGTTLVPYEALLSLVKRVNEAAAK